VGGTSAGQPSGPGATLPARETLAERFRGTISNTFDQTLTGVLNDANRGVFDDPAISAQIASLKQRILAGKNAANPPGSSAAGQAVSGAGALGAPTPGQLSGGGPTSTGANAAPTSSPSDDSAQLLQLQLAQAQHRLAAVSQSLQGNYPAAAQLPSALTGGFDFENYRPRTKEDAKAFAQRMAIDVTEGSAQLEVTAAQLEIAKHAAQNTPGPQANNAVRQLQAQFDQQQNLVLAMADVVDRISGGAISKVQGSAPDAATVDMQDAGLAGGATSATDAAKLDKLDAIVNQQTTTGHSADLAFVQHQMSQFLTNWILKQNDEWDKQQQKQDDDDREKAQDERIQDQARNDSLTRKQLADNAAADSRARHDQDEQLARQHSAS
jgi:hypothetical protein